MRIIVVVLTFCSIFSGGALPATAQPAAPDFRIAYALAAASYCAYAVGPKFAGKEQPDNGRDLAYRCVKAASNRDPTLAKIGFTVESKDDVEVYPSRPKNAVTELSGADSIDGYLLLNTRMGVVIAFRGTLFPPISPDDTADMDHWDVLKKAIVNAAARKAWGAFVSDWLNNAFVQLDGRQRHTGFDESWGRLEAHLNPTCRIDPLASGKFCAFIAEKNGVRPNLFITGHSKGGAIATLAGLDLADAQPTVPQRVFTFAAAKSVATAEAISAPYTSRQFWRFERDGDLVPTLPTDDSPPFAALVKLANADLFGIMPKFSTYAHFGPRILYLDSTPPVIASPVNGRDAPDDWSRWQHIAKIEAPVLLQAILTKTLQKDREFECPLVTNHLAIFADVQASAWPGGTPPPGADMNAARFFRYGLRDDEEKSVLPGYEDWCRWLNAF
jgi:Lipase (class 3)